MSSAPSTGREPEEPAPGTTRFTVSIPESLHRAFLSYLEERRYPNRSEAVRDLIRNALIEEQWADDTSEVVGTVTLVYDHHIRELTDRLTRVQHEFHDVIIATTHVHLDHSNCLEAIVLRGTANRVRAVAYQLTAVRGVKHGKLVCTGSGAGLA